MLHGRLFSGEFGPMKKVFPYRYVDCVLHVFPTGWEGNQSTVGVFNSLAERKYFIYISQGFLGFLATEVFFVGGCLNTASAELPGKQGFSGAYMLWGLQFLISLLP